MIYNDFCNTICFKILTNSFENPRTRVLFPVRKFGTPTPWNDGLPFETSIIDTCFLYRTHAIEIMLYFIMIFLMIGWRHMIETMTLETPRKTWKLTTA